VKLICKIGTLNIAFDLIIDVRFLWSICYIFEALKAGAVHITQKYQF